MPGKPLEKESFPELNCLWTLSYIRNNTIKFTILKLPESVTVDRAVELAKGYCTKQSWRFSWLERTVVELADTAVKGEALKEKK